MKNLENLVKGLVVGGLLLGVSYCATPKQLKYQPNPLSPEVQEVQKDSRGEFRDLKEEGVDSYKPVFEEEEEEEK